MIRLKMSTSPFRQEPPIYGTALVSSEVLEVSRAGKKILKFLMENKLLQGDLVEIQYTALLNYLAQKYGIDYASSQNIKRGIKNLIECEILAESDSPMFYHVNRRFISQ